MAACEPARVPDLMNAADCLLVTSDAEGSPTMVQEALATNLPVVSVDVGDIAERLEGVACSSRGRAGSARAGARPGGGPESAAALGRAQKSGGVFFHADRAGTRAAVPGSSRGAESVDGIFRPAGDRDRW